MQWFEKRNLLLGIALSTLSLVISGCERQLPKPPAGLLSSPDARRAGAATFAARCAICHGIHGDGQGRRKEGMDPAPADLTLPPWSEKANAPRIYVAIRDGVPGTPMTSWAMLGERRIWELVAYLTSLKDERAQ